MDSSLIEFNNVYKSYSISRLKYKRFAEDIGQIFQRVLTRKKRTIQKEKFVALKNVNFKVKQGESLGIIGAFIELGAGLHPQLSGRENIYLYGSILGMRKKEIDEKFDDIVKFSELRKFLDTPIKRYSSGMYARLGFSVVAFMDPDILVIDEVLAVGDKSFQERCLSKMNKFVKGNKTIIFVSHNLEAVKSICDRGILLDHGKIIKDGRVSEVINTYLANYS